MIPKNKKKKKHKNTHTHDKTALYIMKHIHEEKCFKEWNILHAPTPPH